MSAFNLNAPATEQSPANAQRAQAAWWAAGMDAADALQTFITSPSGFLLDELTRKYLLVAWACQRAAMAWQYQTHATTNDIAAALVGFEGLCQQAQISYMQGLEDVLCQPLPWDMRALCAFISDFAAQGAVGPVLTTQPLSGFFISIEGGDGSGKSTQAKNLAALLQQHNIQAVATRALGGTAGSAQELRALILAPEYKWHSVSEGVLTIAIYREGLKHVIVPALQAGQVVVSDRWLDTMPVYLSDVAQGLTADIYHLLYDVLVRDIAPDLLPHITFLLDIDYETALQRREARPSGVDGAPAAAGQLDRNEGKGEAFHRGVLARYKEQALANRARFITVDATRPAEDVLAELLAHSIHRYSQAQQVVPHENESLADA